MIHRFGRGGHFDPWQGVTHRENRPFHEYRDRPYILRTMFAGVREKLPLKLITTRAFGNGKVLLCYVPDPGR